MVNVNVLSAALWKLQIAKLELVAFNKRNGLEGSWGATQELADIVHKEVSLQNAINLVNLGLSSDTLGEVEFMANQVVCSYPAVR